VNLRFAFPGNNTGTVRRLGTLLCATLLALLSSMAAAGEPCSPFEGGRVDMQLLETMREAAHHGHLYRVVPGESYVGFCVRHFPGHEFRGEFTNIVGGLSLPPESEGHGHALLLVHTSTMQSSNPDMEEIVTGHKWMDTERYPEILFAGHEVEWVQPWSGYVYGDITLHGITQPIVFSIEMEVLNMLGDSRPARIHLEGKGAVNRKRFGMRNHPFVVSENVRLCLSVELVLWEQ